MKIDVQVLQDLVPHGVMRAAINVGNTVLAQRGSSGELSGVTVDLARALAERLNVPLEFVVYDAAGKVFNALAEKAWDVGFLAIDTTRAEQVNFSPPYLQIEGCYAVRRAAPWQESSMLDIDTVRIAVSKGSAYELFLSRHLKAAHIERFDTTQEAFDGFIERGLEAVAGIRTLVEEFASTRHDLRVFDDNFMTIQQAMCVPRPRSAAAAFIARFIEDMKAQGAVADSLVRSGQTAAKVASPANL